MSRIESKKPQNVVARRRVFYLPGYDPFHPRRYRELYRKESLQQAEISGYEISISPRRGEGSYGWLIESTQDGLHTSTEIQVLVWQDIVKASMDQGIAGTYAQLARTAWVYIGSGALWRLMRLRKGPMIAALYPVVFLLGQLAIALLIGFGLYQALTHWIPEYMTMRLVFGLASIGVIVSVLKVFQRYDAKVFAYYLMHDYAFSAQSKGRNPTELEERMRGFAKQIEDALRSDVDEVLIVGHSSGAHLGVSILADMVRAGCLANRTPTLSFLSLGQVVPMVSFLPDAARLRADLRLMGKQNEIQWVDVTAPGDGCAFALCDPVAVSGMTDAETTKPLVISAAFTQTLSADRWKALRWRFFRLHFQYLCAFDNVGDYDYFRITAGPLTLGQRFKDRSPSPSRKLDAVNRYVSEA